ncbi:MAG TPA: hypothetical protein VH079_07885 [Terriglobales bacterium]|jgi:hypothetical protein|nr:hypothetical protein [Terriglobales bacterium]
MSEPGDVVFTDDSATVVKESRELGRVQLANSCVSSERMEMTGK